MEQKDEKKSIDASIKDGIHTTHTSLYRIMKTIGISFGILCGTAIVAFAISSKITEDTTKLSNRGGVIEFVIDIGDLESKSAEVVSGTVQTISTPVKNDSGEPMYMFVRLDFGTWVDDSGATRPLYSFEPTDSWTVVNTGDKSNMGQVVLAGTGGSERLEAVEAQDSVDLEGTLTCLVTKKAFGTITDFAVDFTGIGIVLKRGIRIREECIGIVFCRGR